MRSVFLAMVFLVFVEHSAVGQDQKGSPKASAAKPATASRSAPLEFRLLLIIKKETRVNQEGLPKVRATLSPENIAGARRAFTVQAPEFIRKATRGRVVWKTEVVVSEFPLERVSRQGEKGAWIAPDDVARDYEKYVPIGKYDGVYFYWPCLDEASGESLQSAFGWSLGPERNSNWCGHTDVQYVATEGWDPTTTSYEIFVHEWFHQIEGFYRKLGLKQLPEEGCHAAERYGFESKNLSWGHFYIPYLNAELPNPDGTRSGLGEAAWSLGTPRQAYAFHAPEYLTPERRAANLLDNGSFERPTGTDWVAVSSRKTPNFAERTRERAKQGGWSLRVSVSDPQGDHARYGRRVKVRPNTRYLLSGWVRPQGVRIVQERGWLGASLSVEPAGYVASQSVAGDRDWTYATVEFDSGDRTEVTVFAGVGFYESLATGTAWFDDLVVIELPPAEK